MDWASGKANKLIKWDLEWFANRWNQLNKVCSWGITTKFHDSIKSNEGWSIYQLSDKHKLVLSRSVPSSSSSIIAYSQIESLIDTLWTQGPQYLVLCTCTVARIYIFLKTSQGSYLWFHVYHLHTEIHARNETAILRCIAWISGDTDISFWNTFNNGNMCFPYMSCYGHVTGCLNALKPRLAVYGQYFL